MRGIGGFRDHHGDTPREVATGHGVTAAQFFVMQGAMGAIADPAGSPGQEKQMRLPALLAAIAVLALAMPATAAPDSKTFGTWTVRCNDQQDKAVPSCDMSQAATKRDTGQTLLTTSFTYLPVQKKYVGQVVLPLGFLIQPGILIRLDEKVDIKDWKVIRCIERGCFVENAMDADALKPFRAGKGGVVVVINEEGKGVAYPLSLDGFSAALDEVVARNKAAAEAPAQPAP